MCIWFFESIYLQHVWIWKSFTRLNKWFAVFSPTWTRELVLYFLDFWSVFEQGKLRGLCWTWKPLREHVQVHWWWDLRVEIDEGWQDFQYGVVVELEVCPAFGSLEFGLVAVFAFMIHQYLVVYGVYSVKFEICSEMRLIQKKIDFAAVPYHT